MRQQSKLGHVINEIEETAIAIILGLMTLITFVNVVLRYGFNTSLIVSHEAEDAVREVAAKRDAET
jgi:C4-dicarboxylate transporter DctQ subunit